MITKQMESICESDLVLANKLCKALGCEPVEEPPGTSARRNLFGCLEDSSAVNELLLRQAAEMAQRSAEIWSFDFETERPIPGGRYAWERLGDPGLPQWYPEQCGSAVGEKENTLTGALPTISGDSECGPSGIKIKCNTTKSRLVQTSIKGYMPVQKRKTGKGRLRSKRLSNTRFLVPGPRDYILSTAGSSKRS